MKERNQKVICLYISPYKEITPNSGNYIRIGKPEVVAFTFKPILDNIPSSKNYTDSLPKFTTDFYLHGQSGIFDIKETLRPTYWYDELHPFEFEFVVNEKLNQLKVFNNLILISNKAEPESFHFEIEGDNYEFSSDKRTMYFRQEATKELFLNLGSDILFDRYYPDVATDTYTLELYYRKKQRDDDNDSDNYTKQYIKMDKVYPIEEKGLVLQVKSTIFPLYYKKTDTYNDVYYKYTLMEGGDTYNFANLSGSEIIWNKDLNQFDIITHIKNSPIDLVGRARGNSLYKEGKWNIQIPSILFCLKNEEDWENKINIATATGTYEESFKYKVPPIVINLQGVPNDLKSYVIDKNAIPNIYNKDGNILKYVHLQEADGWTERKETRIRDKWIKIRIRYSGKNLAVIHSLVTLYNLSYS